MFGTFLLPSVIRYHEITKNPATAVRVEVGEDIRVWINVASPSTSLVFMAGNSMMVESRPATVCVAMYSVWYNFAAILASTFSIEEA
jgi:hypothetical protein